MKFLARIIIYLILLSGLALASEVRIYRQFKDVSMKENGNVTQSKKDSDLFEFTYLINLENNTITRTKIRRLDEPLAHYDAMVYSIIQKKEVLGSPFGKGGRALVAISEDGNELLELSHRFAFTMRTSPFSQVITGVYKRVHEKRSRNQGPRKF